MVWPHCPAREINISGTWLKSLLHSSDLVHCCTIGITLIATQATNFLLQNLFLWKTSVICNGVYGGFELLNWVVILVQMPLYLCLSSIIMIRRITTIIIINNNNSNKRRVNELNHISTTVETDALRSVVSHDARTHKNKPWANLTCFSHHEESPLSKPAWWKNPTSSSNYHLLPPVDKHDILLTALSWPFTCQWVGGGGGSAGWLPID